MNVVELWPGGGYWTDILGPYLAPSGHYTVALPPSGGEEGSSAARFRTRIAAEKGRLGIIHETTLGAGQFEIAPAGSADLVLTFRNLHNWMSDGYADQALAACFSALKPGGILGIEEHRGRNDVPQDPKAESGYVRQDLAIAMAKKAGFVLVASSEINANPATRRTGPRGFGPCLRLWRWVKKIATSTSPSAKATTSSSSSKNRAEATDRLGTTPVGPFL
jgi:predicted methyltransferase